MAGYTILPDEDRARASAPGGVLRSDIGPPLTLQPVPPVTEADFQPGGPRTLAAPEYQGNARTLKSAEPPEERAGDVKPNEFMVRHSPPGGALRPVGYTILPDTAPAAKAPRASQADVRASEPPAPAERQAKAERDFETAMKAWRRATGGRLKPGQNERQATTEFSGLQDPRETNVEAGLQELGVSGTFPESDSVGYMAAKGLAGTAGFTLGGPYGASVLQALVDVPVVMDRVTQAVKAGYLPEDEAAEIMATEIGKRVGFDAAMNFGLPMLFKLIGAYIPQSLKDKVGRAIQKGASKFVSDKGDELAKLTDDPYRQQAVRKLVERTEGDAMPTRGQITKEAGTLESAARMTKGQPFQRSEDALIEATEKEREALIRPVVQGTREQFGKGVLKTLDDVEKAVKERTGKVFDKAQGVEGQVNMQGVLDAVDNTLALNLGAKNRPLSSSERADLEELRRLLTPDEFAPPTSPILSPSGAFFPGPEMAPPQPIMSIKDAMNFLSGNKAKLRSVNPDGKAGNMYTALMANIDKQTDDAVKAAIGKASPALRAELEGARASYREMMETVYDDASKAALKAVPEDILKKFVQTGNVTEIRQYQRLLDIAQREGKMTGEEAAKANQRLARGFLDGVATDAESLANWSAKLRANTPMRETWDAITEAAGGAELKSAMRVLEQMAQIARSEGMTTSGQFIPLTRAQHGGMGMSFVTGTARPGMILMGFSLTGITKALATMYTQGEKGMINHMVKAMRASQAGTPAAVEATKASFQAISKWVEENGAEDPFVYNQATEEK